ncbi:hypothetical protein LAB1_56940 [Roseibium sp. LAB1]
MDLLGVVINQLDDPRVSSDSLLRVVRLVDGDQRSTSDGHLSVGKSIASQVCFGLKSSLM